MKRFTICEANGGYLIVDGEWNYNTALDWYLQRNLCHTFNSLDKAVAHIRGKMKAWSDKQPTPNNQPPTKRNSNDR